MKFCKDCKFFCLGFPPKCTHRHALRVDVVTGDRSSFYCEVMRTGIDCGFEANLFEPKQSAPEREP